MRLAILPITSFRHLAGESEVVMFSAMIRQWVHDNEDCWLYIVLPRDCIDQGWVGLTEQWPRCSVVWEDELGLYYDKLAEVPVGFMRTFNMRNGAFQIDGLVTSRRAAAALMAREVWDHRLKQTIPVFIDESMTAEWGRTPSTVSDIDLVAQTLGYAVGWPIWDTEIQRVNALDAARHWLAGARILKVMEKGVVIPCGFSPQRIDDIVEKARTGDVEGKEETFTCFFGGRLNRGSKRADVLLREYDSFFKFGRDVQITVCSPKEEGWILDLIRAEYPEINVLIHTPSDEFVARASRAHVFLNTSASEGFSVGFAEMMYMTKYGTVLIAPRLPWVKGMFAEEYDRYPFLYEDFEQARVMLRWVHENYAEAVGKAQYLGDWVASKYDSKTTYSQHWEHYRTVIDREVGMGFVKNLMSESNRELVLEAFEQMDQRFSLDVLYREMIARSRAMKEDPRRGQTTKWAVRRWLMLAGHACDTFDTPMPELVKR